jgi:bifunctional polynucleotide phosphatase/kinase
VVPQLAFAQFKSNFEEPELVEGFTQIKKVNWVFSGSQEERETWGKWLEDEKEW